MVFRGVCDRGYGVSRGNAPPPSLSLCLPQALDNRYVRQGGDGNMYYLYIYREIEEQQLLYCALYILEVYLGIPRGGGNHDIANER